jgi:hypothetical protein
VRIFYEPCWTGLLLNMVCFGGGYWLLELGAKGLMQMRDLIRRGRRRRRGLCVSCGYDLRGSMNGACPECGGFP